jgi:hypothetical protein
MLISAVGTDYARVVRAIYAFAQVRFTNMFPSFKSKASGFYMHLQWRTVYIRITESACILMACTAENSSIVRPGLWPLRSTEAFAYAFNVQIRLVRAYGWDDVNQIYD